MRSEPILKKLGAEIRERRRARNLSQLKLAEAAGVNSNTIQRLENAETDSQILTLFNVALGLNMPLSELIAGAERR